MTTPRRNRIFISYSHQAPERFQRIRRVFAADHRNGHKDARSDQELEFCKDFRPQIIEAINAARVAVLLVSPGFLESPFILNEELPSIREAQADGLTILWVPLTSKFYGPEAHATPTCSIICKRSVTPARPSPSKTSSASPKSIRALCRQVDEHVGITRQYRNLPLLSIGDFFKDREDDLKRIEQTLDRDGAAAISQALTTSPNCYRPRTVLPRRSH